LSPLTQGRELKPMMNTVLWYLQSVAPHAVA